MYLAGEADDDRVDEALNDVRPLDVPEDTEADGDDLQRRVERLEEELNV